MSNKEIMEDLKSEGLDKYGSWAVYGGKATKSASNHETIHVTDIGFPDNLSMSDLANKINTQCMCVGSSVAKRENRKSNKNKSWYSFHETEQPTKDYNILKILTDSGYIGAYITDIIKFPHDAKEKNKNSHNIFTRMKNACENQETSDDYHTFQFSMEKFKKELRYINPQIIILFGKPAFQIFQLAVNKRKLQFSKKVIVVETLHYSKPGESNDSMYNRLKYDKFKKERNKKGSKWYAIDEKHDFKLFELNNLK